MKKILFAIALALAPMSAMAGSHVAVKIQATGLNLSASTGATLGYLGATVDTAAITKKDGTPLDASAGVCSRNTSVNTFTNMNSKANATASTLPTTVPNSPIAGPAVAVATGDESANGGAAIVAAAALTANPAAVIDAYCGNPVLANAPSGSQIRPNGQ